MSLELIVIVKDIITTLMMTKVKVEHQTKKLVLMDLKEYHIGIEHIQTIKDISIYLYHETIDIVYRSGHQTQMIMQETTHHIHLTDIILQMLLTQEQHLTFNLISLKTQVILISQHQVLT